MLHLRQLKTLTLVSTCNGQPIIVKNRHFLLSGPHTINISFTRLRNSDQIRQIFNSGSTVNTKHSSPRLNFNRVATRSHAKFSSTDRQFLKQWPTPNVRLQRRITRFTNLQYPGRRTLTLHNRPTVLNRHFNRALLSSPNVNRNFATTNLATRLRLLGLSFTTSSNLTEVRVQQFRFGRRLTLHSRLPITRVSLLSPQNSQHVRNTSTPNLRRQQRFRNTTPQRHRRRGGHRRPRHTRRRTQHVHLVTTHPPFTPLTGSQRGGRPSRFSRRRRGTRRLRGRIVSHRHGSRGRRHTPRPHTMAPGRRAPLRQQQPQFQYQHTMTGRHLTRAPSTRNGHTTLRIISLPRVTRRGVAIGPRRQIRISRRHNSPHHTHRRRHHHTHQTVKRRQPNRRYRTNRGRFNGRPTNTSGRSYTPIISPPNVASINMRRQRRRRRHRTRTLRPAANTLNRRHITRLITRLNRGRHRARHRHATRTRRIQRHTSGTLPITQRRGRPRHRHHQRASTRHVKTRTLRPQPNAVRGHIQTPR